MPQASIKIGVDLDKIPPIKGCVTFQCDITTPKCVALIKKELKHFQADVVLNDGAPNVGTDWNLDAYAQIELSLHALKLATQVLRKGGTFVSKVFRSKDYNSYLYILNQLFTKVESSKPSASRQQSAEIFMVCLGYKAPDYIDPKFLDPKFAFEDISGVKGSGEAGEDTTQKITSLKKLIEKKKKNRSGYDDDANQRNNLYNEADLIDYLECQDPFEYLTKFYKFNIDARAKEVLEKHAKMFKVPEDFEEMLQDIKVLGRREAGILLRMNHKYQNILNDVKVAEDKKTKALEEEAKALEPVDEDALLDQQLEATLHRIQREKKRVEKKERVLKAKSDLRKKMSVIASSGVDGDDEDLHLSQKLWDKVRAKGFDKVGEKSDDDDSSEEVSEEEE